MADAGGPLAHPAWRRSWPLGHGGVRGNPCLFPARFFPELLELREDHGGNTVIRRHEADLLLLDVPAEELRDVDTAQALEELKAEEQV